MNEHFGGAVGRQIAEAEQGRPTHAYLVVSPDERTNAYVADGLLAACVYGSATEENAARAALLADVVKLPHGDKVLVSDVEELTDTVYFTPTELDRRYYLIGRAETMNETAQNKLLKVLEEPPSAVVIILCCTQKSAMLPTVLSRVRTVEVPPLSESEISAYLMKKYGSGQKVELAAALSGGYIGKAEEAVEKNEHAELFRLALDTLKNMPSSKHVLRFSARIMVHKDRIAEFTDILEMLLCDCMALSAGADETVKFRFVADELKEVAAGYTAEVVVRLRPVLMRAKRRLAGNGNVQSVLDEMLFSMLEVKAKCRR